MKRSGVHRPTVEDAVEISGIETLHPGGFALTRRTAEVAGLKPGLRVLDVSSGRGTQAVFYATEYGVDVTGIDLSEEMVRTARERASATAVSGRVRFDLGDSQKLPYRDATFDVAINECAVGIPDDSQSVLSEMARVVKPGGRVVIHESTWRKPLGESEKRELAERYGTTPLEREEWTGMMRAAGLEQVEDEAEPWSRPAVFWNVRQGRTVCCPMMVLTPGERLRTLTRLLPRYGLKGAWKVLANERAFFRAVKAEKIGYGLYWGRRPGMAVQG
jgi:SAM-dependent methyltransferase